MERDFENRNKDDTPPKVHHRIRWPALIIWPTFVITIVIFVLSMIPFVRDKSGKINIHESINNLITIVTRQENVRIEIIQPNENFLSIKSAIETYLFNTNEYPETLNDLIIDPGISGWTGPYLKQSQVFDKWNRPFIYIQTGTSYTLISLGADGLPGGQDDNADIHNN